MSAVWSVLRNPIFGWGLIPYSSLPHHMNNNNTLCGHSVYMKPEQALAELGIALLVLSHVPLQL